MEINPNLTKQKEEVKDIDNLLATQLHQTNDVDTAVDICTSRQALKNIDNTVQLVKEKEEEFLNKAQAKRIKAEVEKIHEETEKLKVEKERMLAEYDQRIAEKEKEIEALNKDADKAQAFFDANKEILKCINIRSKKSLGALYGFMIPASIVFVLVQIVLLPLSILGLLIEGVLGIVGAICGEIKNNAIKIVLAVIVITLITALLIIVYVYGGKLLVNI